MTTATVFNKTFRTRFDAKVERGEGCWVWTGLRTQYGYGTITNGAGCKLLAHRASWELHVGPIPDGLWVLHRCDNPPCVNPAHLFLGTHADNVRDMWAKGRQINHFVLAKEHRTACVNGHPFTPENTMLRDRGKRRCRTCQLEAYKRYNRKRSA